MGVLTPAEVEPGDDSLGAVVMAYRKVAEEPRATARTQEKTPGRMIRPGVLWCAREELNLHVLSDTRT